MFKIKNFAVGFSWTFCLPVPQKYLPNIYLIFNGENNYFISKVFSFIE